MDENIEKKIINDGAPGEIETDQITPEGTLEAVLFSLGEPVELKKLASVTGKTPEETRKCLEKLAARYQDPSSGIMLLRLESSYQLCTKKQYFETLVEVARQPRKPHLTDVVIETLSIIAYKQPVTKAEIEQIRGVKSDHAINKLMEYGLVKELGRLDAAGRPILFGTTDVFLRYMGLDSTESLPRMSVVQEEDFRAEAEAEMNERIKVDV